LLCNIGTVILVISFNLSYSPFFSLSNSICLFSYSTFFPLILSLIFPAMIISFSLALLNCIIYYCIALNFFNIPLCSPSNKAL
jgi:hypothetical protein